MKRILIYIFVSVLCMSSFAQSEQVCNLRVFNNGEVMYLRDINMIDSLNFAMVVPEELGEVDIDSTKQLYIGVVAFNQSVHQLPITSNVDSAKAFINLQTNDKDQTAFAYSVSKGSHLFANTALPTFDKVYMLNFTDGFDNYSNRLYNDEGRQVGQMVYDTAQYDLLQNTAIHSYAIAFGDDSAYRTCLQQLVTGGGGYYKAATSNDLQSTFNEIAKSMIASAKNVILKTNSDYYDETSPQQFQINFISVGGFTDTIYASLIGDPYAGFTLVIDSVVNKYASFDSPAYGVEDPETLKANIPLKNMKFVKDGTDLQFNYEVKVKKWGKYEVDVEDGSASEDISKRIAVVLVLDCSSSMGNAFEPMKAAAVDFIGAMEKMESDSTEVNIPTFDVPTQEELWSKFKTAADVDGDLTSLGTLEELKALEAPFATFCGVHHMQLDNIQKVFALAEWTWLRDYIMIVQNGQKGNAVGTRIVPELTTDIANEGPQWRYAVAAFFLQTQREVDWPATADFSTAGKPEAWGSAYIAAQK